MIEHVRVDPNDLEVDRTTGQLAAVRYLKEIGERDERNDVVLAFIVGMMAGITIMVGVMEVL